MNKNIYYIFLFISLALLQIFVLNNILLLGYINPSIYIAFIFFYPLKKERILFLTLAFLLGLTIDIFSDSGGINAFATLFIAFIRLFFVRLIFKKTELDYLLFKIQDEAFGKVFNYVVILTLIHHFILFSLASFSFSNFTEIIINTLFSSAFTLVLFFLGSYIFSKKL